MKFSFSSNAFTRYKLIETINLIGSLGYEGIEIMADVPHAYPKYLTEGEIAEIRKALDDNGLEIANVNAFMHNADGDTYHPSWIEKDPAERARRVEYTLACIDLAHALGARCISTEPGGPLEEMSRQEGLDFFKEGLKAVEDRAGAKNIHVLIEPEPGLLIENSVQFREFFEELNPEVFGLNFDIGHFFCVGEDPSELIAPLKGFTRHFHLEDIAANRVHRHLLLGEGAIDIGGILTTITETGYSGFVTVELYTYEHAAVDAAKSSLDYLNRWRG